MSRVLCAKRETTVRLCMQLKPLVYNLVLAIKNITYSNSETEAVPNLKNCTNLKYNLS